MYVVPTYQRLYVWSREDQWEPLWSDVEEIANVLVEDAVNRGSESVDANLREPHFLGAVVLKISGVTPELASELRVIDGQQRLTTLQLLIAATVAEFEHIGLSGRARLLRGLTTNPSGSTAPGNDGYKIRHLRYEQGYAYDRFGDVMSAALSGNSTDSIDGPMAECYRFLCQMIRGWLSEQDGHVEAAAQALATTLTMKLQVVGIYLAPHEKEHIIFETLNARGEPLTEWDKIKNYLLYRADEEPDLDQEWFFKRYLDRFDDPWWRTGVGRLLRPRTDIFADYWLRSLDSRGGAPVPLRRVFREFQKHADHEDQHLEPMMERLIEDANHFRLLEELDATLPEGRETQFHSRRLAIGIGAIWPLLLRLNRIDAGQQERDRWFTILESYIVRRMITGYRAQGYNDIALELINALGTNRQSAGVADMLVERLLHYQETSLQWPTDAEVKQAVLNRKLPQYAQRLVLSAIEKHLRVAKWAEGTDPSPELQIEHIMPRAWQSEWPLPDSIDQPLARERRQAAIETLGNLTLLNGRLNAAVSNASWRVKRPDIKESYTLFLNKHLLDSSADDEWTEADIERRGEWMYGIIIDIWPRG